LLDGTVTDAIHGRAKEAFAIYASGIERALSRQADSLVGENISLADICFAAELTLFNNEHQRAPQLKQHGLSKILHSKVSEDYPLMTRHFARLVAHENFKPDLEPYLQKLLAAAEYANPAASTSSAS